MGLYSTVLLIVGFGLCCLVVDIVRMCRHYERLFSSVFYFGWALIAWPTSLILWEVIVAAFDDDVGVEGVGSGAAGVVIGIFTIVPGLVFMMAGVFFRR
jgi:hypothetical protein